MPFRDLFEKYHFTMSTQRDFQNSRLTTLERVEHDRTGYKIRRPYQRRYRHFRNQADWQAMQAARPRYPSLDDHDIVGNWRLRPFAQALDDQQRKKPTQKLILCSDDMHIGSAREVRWEKPCKEKIQSIVISHEHGLISQKVT